MIPFLMLVGVGLMYAGDLLQPSRLTAFSDTRQEYRSKDWLWMKIGGAIAFLGGIVVLVCG